MIAPSANTVVATAELIVGQLLLNALVVWSSNLIVFGLLFWELDGGGPLQRVVPGSGAPDFQFPQDVNPDRASPAWRPASWTLLRLPPELTRLQPDGRDAAVAHGEIADEA